MIKLRRLLYAVSNNEDTRSFHPNENKPFSLSNENIFFGLHFTVNQSIKVSIAVLESCCATSAHTPNPIYAIAIPKTAEKIVPPIVEKKNLLNSIFLYTYACCIPFTPDITIVKLITRITGVNVVSL